MREIGLMGGAYNPPHFGHLQMAMCALEQHHLDKVIFMPSGTPPHKKDDLLDKEMRFELIDAEVKAMNDPRFEASRLEIDRAGVTWTIDTLKELRLIYGPDVRFNFIIGEDNISSIARYDRRAELLSLCRLLVAPRGIASPNSLEQWKKTLPEAGEDGIAIIDCPANALSSTLVRENVRAGRSIRYLVPPAVIAVIEARGHYKDPLPATPPPAGPAATQPDPATANTDAGTAATSPTTASATTSADTPATPVIPQEAQPAQS